MHKLLNMMCAALKVTDMFFFTFCTHNWNPTLYK